MLSRLQDPKIDGTRLRFLTLDVTSPIGEIKERMDEALAIWGRIDVLVNNAGRLTYGASEELGCVFNDHPCRVGCKTLTFGFIVPKEL
jgi:NAD(P)-dependent dehydrogenase (short-subunit alcohol dehydrogenase family)